MEKNRRKKIEMKHLNRDIIVFLIGIRWFGLLLGIISYMKNYDGSIIMMIPLAFINLYYTFNINRIPTQYQAFAIAFLDIFCNLVLSYQTDGFNSPFFIYSLTTFVWLMFHTSISTAVITFIWYTVISLGMEFYVRPELWPVKLSKLIWESQILLIIAIFMFIIYHYGKTIVTIYRNIYFIKKVARLIIPKDVKEMTEKIEGLLDKLFHADETYICWLHPKVEEFDWKHNHYKYMIQTNGAISQKRLGYHIIQGIDGQHKSTITFPIIGNREVIAYIVLVNEQRRLIKRFDLLYLHLISFVLHHRFQVILQTKELEESMKQELRIKLAQDMHDGLAQQLFFLNAKVFQLKMLAKKYEDPSLLEIIDHVGSQVENSHQEVRNYIESIRNIKKETNLLNAIEKLLEKLVIGLGIEVEIEYKAGTTQESVEVEETIYRFIEEAVNNVLKHARASNIHIIIDCNTLVWTIIIKDNGIGIESVDMITSSRFGVRGMRERIEKLKGNVYFETAKNKGTSVTAIIPRRR
ncbi:MAG: sensor histidine kinase [Bacillaceae bacterium]